MAGKLDIAKLAQRLTELNTKGNKSGLGMGFISLKDGRNVVRILPPKEGSDWFAKEVFVHYGVGKHGDSKGQMVVCPTTNGDKVPCPMCELVREIRKLSKKQGDKYDKQAGEMSRKKRVYFNALDRNEDLNAYEKTQGEDGKDKWVYHGEEGDLNISPVRVLATGIDVYKQILGIITDPEYGDITDPKNGLDVIITKSGTGRNTKYDVKTVRKESPIGFDEWEENLNDLEVLGKVSTYDEVAALMSGESSTESDDTEDNNDDTSEESTSSSNNKGDKEPEDNGDDIQNEIQQALNRRKNSKK